ncbi:DUF4232 domain-containing protein [Saccharothrix hoggarensis]|uniref:DUF4232 domain-containing protein n=1 Tax=Saccharothrix hoggarensis TaxID=913853 RepID=A0ABW3QXY9_9PSEU
MRRLVAFGALAVALTACGSPQQAADQASLAVEPSSETTSATTSAPASPSASPLPPSTTPTGAAGASGRCNASVLAGSVETSDAGAGNRYGKLLVTNTGSAPCTLNGYSGLQLLDGAGNPVPTDLRRTTDPGPSPVTLAPGTMAAANLHWTVVPAGDEPVDRPCQAEATSAAAIPPDETQPMSLAWGLGPVCGGGKIEISAFYAA